MADIKPFVGNDGPHGSGNNPTTVANYQAALVTPNLTAFETTPHSAHAVTPGEIHTNASAGAINTVDKLGYGSELDKKLERDYRLKKEDLILMKDARKKTIKEGYNGVVTLTRLAPTVTHANPLELKEQQFYKGTKSTQKDIPTFAFGAVRQWSDRHKDLAIDVKEHYNTELIMSHYETLEEVARNLIMTDATHEYIVGGHATIDDLIETNKLTLDSLVLVADSYERAGQKYMKGSKAYKVLVSLPVMQQLREDPRLADIMNYNDTAKYLTSNLTQEQTPLMYKNVAVYQYKKAHFIPSGGLDSTVAGAVTTDVMGRTLAAPKDFAIHDSLLYGHEAFTVAQVGSTAEMFNLSGASITTASNPLNRIEESKGIKTLYFGAGVTEHLSVISSAGQDYNLALQTDSTMLSYVGTLPEVGDTLPDLF